MKARTKRILITLGVVVITLVLAGFIGYKGFYAKVYNQSNVEQNLAIGTNTDASIQTLVEEISGFPNRFAGTKSNARAVQYLRNYFREAGVEPYFEDTYYHSFYSDWLKCSRYYIVPVSGTVENVAAKITGADSSKAVVITAHMDSYLGKGVLDNASGTAVLLETAKRLSQRFPQGTYPVDLVFVAYNAEESGMVGSRAFYEVLDQDYTDFYNINMDCVGALDKPLAVRNVEENSEALYQDFLPVLEQHDIPIRDIAYAADEDGEPLGTSDHAAFQEHGRAAIILGEDELRGYTNTKQDRDLNVLDYPELERLADAVEEFIAGSGGKIY